MTDVHTSVTLSVPATGPALRAIREHYGRSLGQVADAGGVSLAGLSRVETGQRNLGIKVALAYSRALPVSFLVSDGDVVAKIEFGDVDEGDAFLAASLSDPALR